MTGWWGNWELENWNNFTAFRRKAKFVRTIRASNDNYTFLNHRLALIVPEPVVVMTVEIKKILNGNYSYCGAAVLIAFCCSFFICCILCTLFIPLRFSISHLRGRVVIAKAFQERMSFGEERYIAAACGNARPLGVAFHQLSTDVRSRHARRKKICYATLTDDITELLRKTRRKNRQAHSKR